MPQLTYSRSTRMSAAEPFNSVKRRQRGAAALEFAVVCNVLFISIFGCIEFARVIMVTGMAEDAAYEAARHIIVPGAKVQEASSVVTKLLGSIRVVPGTVDVKAFNENTSQTEVDEKTTEVQVTVRIPISNICFFAPRFIMGDKSIVTTCTLYTERYHGYYDGSSGT